MPPPPPPPPPPVQPHPETQQSVPVDQGKYSSPVVTTSKTPLASTPPVHTPTIERSGVNTNVDDMATPETPREVAHARKHSFLDRIRMNWSPQSRDSPTSSSRKKPNIEDFHRRNQEFLHKATIVPTFSSPQSLSAANHRRLGSQDRPPASRGTHRRLQSISNDSWDEESETTSGDDRKPPAVPPGGNQDYPGVLIQPPFSTSEETSESGSQLDDERYTDDSDGYGDTNETTSLLPPTGISTNEQDEKNSKYGNQSRYGRPGYGAAGERYQRSLMQGSSKTSSSTFGASSDMSRDSDEVGATERWDNRTAKNMRKSRKKKYRRKSSKQQRSKGHDDDSSDSSSSESPDQDVDYRQWTKKRARMLEKERSRLIEQWKAEARAEAEKSRREEDPNAWYRRLWRATMAEFDKLAVRTFGCLTRVEAFIGNLPLTICAVAMAVVTWVLCGSNLQRKSFPLVSLSIFTPRRYVPLFIVSC